MPLAALFFKASTDAHSKSLTNQTNFIYAAFFPSSVWNQFLFKFTCKLLSQPLFVKFFYYKNWDMNKNGKQWTHCKILWHNSLLSFAVCYKHFVRLRGGVLMFHCVCLYDVLGVYFAFQTVTMNSPAAQ